MAKLIRGIRGSACLVAAFILVLPSMLTTTSLSSSGQLKKTWFVCLPKEVEAYPWDRGGEEGEFWGRSVISELDGSHSRCFASMKAAQWEYMSSNQ